MSDLSARAGCQGAPHSSVLAAMGTNDFLPFVVEMASSAGSTSKNGASSMARRSARNSYFVCPGLLGAEGRWRLERSGSIDPGQPFGLFQEKENWRFRDGGPVLD